MYISWKENRYRHCTKIVAEKGIKGRQVIGNPIASEILLNLEAKVTAMYNDVITYESRYPTIDEVKTALFIKNVARSNKIIEVMGEYINSVKSTVTTRGELIDKRTVSHIIAVKNILGSFCDDTKYDLNFQNLNMDFYEKYSEYRMVTGIMRPGKDGEKKREIVTPNTLGKDIKIIKSFLNWCIKKEYPVNPIFKFFHRPKVKKDSKPLTERELIKLWDLDLSGMPVLEYKLDIFLFLVSTGMRISDYNRFEEGWIQSTLLLIDNNKIKQEYISFRAKKTNTVCQIPYRDCIYFRPKFLVEKYMGKQDTIMPALSGQKLNDSLSTIFQIAGITRIKATSKTARQTFASIKDKQGYTRTSLRRMLGHSSNIVTDDYVGVSPETILQEDFYKSERLKAF